MGRQDAAGPLSLVSRLTQGTVPLQGCSRLLAVLGRTDVCQI